MRGYVINVSTIYRYVYAVSKLAVKESGVVMSLKVDALNAMMINFWISFSLIFFLFSFFLRLSEWYIPVVNTIEYAHFSLSQSLVKSFCLAYDNT